MLTDILRLIVDVVFSLITMALLARFYMQWGRVPFSNPIGQFVIAVTDWAVKPARRVIPGLFGWDMASLLLAWCAQVLKNLLMMILITQSVGVSSMLIPALILGVFGIASMSVYLVMGVVLISVVLSWVGPQAPMAHVFDSLSRPLLAPFRRWIPPIGGIDLSPLFLLLALQILLIVTARI